MFWSLSLTFRSQTFHHQSRRHHQHNDNITEVPVIMWISTRQQVSSLLSTIHSHTFVLIQPVCAFPVLFFFFSYLWSHLVWCTSRKIGFHLAGNISLFLPKFSCANLKSTLHLSFTVTYGTRLHMLPFFLPDKVQCEANPCPFPSINSAVTSWSSGDWSFAPLPSKLPSSVHLPSVFVCLSRAWSSSLPNQVYISVSHLSYRIFFQNRYDMEIPARSVTVILPSKVGQTNEHLRDCCLQTSFYSILFDSRVYLCISNEKKSRLSKWGLAVKWVVVCQFTRYSGARFVYRIINGSESISVFAIRLNVCYRRNGPVLFCSPKGNGRITPSFHIASRYALYSPH